MSVILHVDMDAFYASVEMARRPELRAVPMFVGGSDRGVVLSANYPARGFGITSGMPSTRARRMCPGVVVVPPDFDRYTLVSEAISEIFDTLSDRVEMASIDEAFIDLTGALRRLGATPGEVAERLWAQVADEQQVACSVGIGSSKFIAKLASEAAKPNGQLVVPAGTELEMISPLPVRAVPGVGPATLERLTRLGIVTVADLQQASAKELVRELGQAAGTALHELAFARDDRPVQHLREAKSISVEDTFATDLVDRAEMVTVIERDAATVAERLRKSGLFTRTISIKVRLADFTTWTRSRTLDGATDSTDRIGSVARQLLAGVETPGGVRLLGVGVANFTAAAQEELFWSADEPRPVDEQVVRAVPMMKRRFGADRTWVAGQDVEHDLHGRGWVWGAGHGVVTVRFETRLTGVGPVRSLPADDPGLRPAALLPMAWQVAEDAGSLE